MRALLLFAWISIILLSLAAAFQPPSSSGGQKKPINANAKYQWRRSPSKKFTKKNTTPNSSTSLPVTTFAPPVPTTSSRKKPKRQQRSPKQKVNEKTEFAWLYWLYRQWHDCPVSTVEAPILRQFLPAAVAWQRKESLLGAQRATELVKRYAMEFLAGNPHANVNVKTSYNIINKKKNFNSYYDKLTRAALDAWLQLDDFVSAERLLDDVWSLAVSADSDDSKTQVMQDHVQYQRAYLQDRSLRQKERTAAPTNTVQLLSDLLDKSVAFFVDSQQYYKSKKHHLEDSLVAMEKTILTVQSLLLMGNSNENPGILRDNIDDLESALVLTIPAQEVLVASSEWIPVTFDFWEFLHHSLILALHQTGQEERAHQAYVRMQEQQVQHPRHMSNTIPPISRSSPDSTRQIQAAVQQIVQEHTSNNEVLATDLIDRIHQDKEWQWLQWLSHQLRVTPIGQLDDYILKCISPAIAMHAKRKLKDSAESAQQLLDRFVEEFQAGNPHAIFTTRNANRMFNSVCDAWAKLGDPDRAHAILNRMVELRKEHFSSNDSNNNILKPDVISFSTLAAAYAKKSRLSGADPTAAQQAEQILQRMEAEQLNPTTITYNTVLNALVHSPSHQDLHKAFRAEEIVQRMEQRFEAGYTECEPSIRTYQSLIAVWSRSKIAGSPQRAELVLEKLDGLSRDNPSLQPNAHCFAAAIHAWAYSMELNKARRAYNILTHMRNRYENQQQQQSNSGGAGKRSRHNRNDDCKPNVVVYTAVVNACANPVDEAERAATFEIAQLAFDELNYNPKYGTPNFLTYTAFLKVCATCLEPGDERDGIVRSVFAQCRDAGQVGDVVMEKLQQAASPALFEELTAGLQQREDGSWILPRAWTRKMSSNVELKSRQRPAADRQQQQAPTNSKRSRPEAARMREVRFLSGSSGHYSKGKDEDTISLEEASF
jgi:hypothetical protein